MENTKKTRPRGRPRKFDADQAVATAQRLFHIHGYDALNVADVTAALGINPPSFYAAFGSKAVLFERVLERYAVNGAVPLGELLRPDIPVATGLARMLDAAARLYGADRDASGCIVLEGIGCDDIEARARARAYYLAASETIHAYIRARHPDQADAVAAFVCTTMAGLSAAARAGHGLDDLLASVRLASLAITQALDA